MPHIEISKEIFAAIRKIRGSVGSDTDLIRAALGLLSQSKMSGDEYLVLLGTTTDDNNLLKLIRGKNGS